MRKKGRCFRSRAIPGARLGSTARQKSPAEAGPSAQEQKNRLGAYFAVTLWLRIFAPTLTFVQKLELTGFVAPAHNLIDQTAGSDEQVVPASDYRALQSQVRELQSCNGCSARGRWKPRSSSRRSNTPRGQKTAAAAAVAAEGRFAMNTVAEVIGVPRSNLIKRMRERPKKRISRPPLPEDKLVTEIKAPACPRYPQAPNAGRWLKAIQLQAGLPADERARPTAPSPSSGVSGRAGLQRRSFQDCEGRRLSQRCH